MTENRIEWQVQRDLHVRCSTPGNFNARGNLQRLRWRVGQASFHRRKGSPPTTQPVFCVLFQYRSRSVGLSSNASTVPYGTTICLGNEEAPSADGLDRILAFNECLQQHPHDALKHFLMTFSFCDDSGDYYYYAIINNNTITIILNTSNHQL